MPGQARTGAGVVRSRDGLDAPGGNSLSQVRHRAAGHQTYRHPRDARCGRHRCRPIAPGVP